MAYNEVANFGDPHSFPTRFAYASLYYQLWCRGSLKASKQQMAFWGKITLERLKIVFTTNNPFFLLQEYSVGEKDYGEVCEARMKVTLQMYTPSYFGEPWRIGMHHNMKLLKGGTRDGQQHGRHTGRATRNRGEVSERSSRRNQRRGEVAQG
ncbi:hypothetical protein SUGI_0146400 [Cryptomeria japonica]|nr:hypothetical protein SUGI_0146400 [Cryptomeria japonica]